MPKSNDILPDYQVFNFTGGLRTDKGNSQLRDDELAFVNNVDILPGKIFKRYGSRAFGGFKTGYPVNTETFDSGIFVPKMAIMLLSNRNTEAEGGMIYKLLVTELAGAIVAGDIAISGLSTGDFGTAGTFEIEGDIITYTNNVANVFTVNGVTSSHPKGALIRSFTPAFSAPHDTSLGVGWAYLNSKLLVIYGTSLVTANAPNVIGVIDDIATAVSLPVGLLYPTTYKQRIYALEQSSQMKVYFSELNDPTLWTGGTTGNFFVEDTSGEKIVGQRNYQGHLMIFKQNATWYYNLSVLAEINNQIGAYNNRCHTEINGFLYVFGPKGIYRMAGASSYVNIGEPVKKWLEAFNSGMTVNANNPSYSGDFPNCARYNNKWLLYIGDVTVDQQAYKDVCLVYDTIYRYWTIWTGFTNLQGWIVSKGFPTGLTTSLPESKNKLFFMDDTQNVWEMFDEQFASNVASNPPSLLGGNFSSDKFKDTGNAIPSEVRTKMYGLKSIGWWKKFQYLRLYCDSWPLDVEARTLTKTGNSNWKSLGQVRGPEMVFKVDMEGYGIQLRFSESSQNAPWSVLGFIFEKTLFITQWHS